MKKLVVLTILAMVFLSTAAFSQKTQLKLINNSNKTVNAAFAEYYNTTSGWVSRGWWVLKPGESKLVNLQPNCKSLYVYGYSSSGTVWGKGPYQFCINKKNAFNIKNADKAACAQKVVFGKKFVIKAGKVNSWSFNP